MSVDLTVVVPVKDEVQNAGPLLREILAALRGRVAFEVVFVDDASSDGTFEALMGLRGEAPELRIVRHSENCGQSAGVRTGVTHARGGLVVTLDGDGQNDPADIPALLAAYRAADAPANLRMVAGERRTREDNVSKRIASRVGNGVRRWALQDGCDDTGCGLKLFARDAFLRLPHFTHMHRFLPALMQREGYAVRFVKVNHRPRAAGRSKYGVLDRLAVSLTDILGVMWLQRRGRIPRQASEA